MEKRYKEIDGVKYQVIQNTILGSNVVPVGETLPEVTTSDNGKLLGVSSGEWTPVDAPSGLPDITGNAGKVLKVNAGATGTEWANETTELPAVTSADEGDVLTVNASGEWEAAPGGGGGLTLYGPYYASPSAGFTIEAGASQNVNLNSFYQEFGEYSQVDLPTIAASEEIFLYISSFSSKSNGADLLIQNITGKIASNAYPTMTVKNIGDSSGTVGKTELTLRFYSPVEFPVHQS